MSSRKTIPTKKELHDCLEYIKNDGRLVQLQKQYADIERHSIPKMDLNGNVVHDSPILLNIEKLIELRTKEIINDFGLTEYINNYKQ